LILLQVSEMPNSLPAREPANHLEFPGLERSMFVQVLFGYGLVEAALWMPFGATGAVTAVVAIAGIFAMSAASPFSTTQLGLRTPPFRGSLWITGCALVLAAAIASFARITGAHQLPTHVLSWQAAAIYAVWALVQQFLLQSFFFVRFEALLGPLAVPATALLFAGAHVPNLLLTVLSFAGGWFFCEMFRRYRNIYPLGAAHAILGLTIAASFSNNLLHGMRVGFGYLVFHSLAPN
jgi:hypothetical protein